MRSAFRMMAMVAMVAVSHTARGQQTYTLTDLGVISGTDTGPRGIANGGAITVSQLVSGFPRGFLVNSGSSVPIGTLGGSSTQSTAVAVNGTSSAVQIAGFSTTSGGETHAFLWTQGGTGGVSGNPQMKDLGKLGGTRSEAYAINTTGRVAGYSEVASGYEHAFLYNGTTMVDVGAMLDSTLGLPWSYAYGVNATSRVVGVAFNDTYTVAVAFLYSGTSVRSLGNLGFAWSEAFAINDANQVVGYSTLSDGSEEAFIWNGTSMASLGSLGGSSYALAINNSGAVVGGSYTDNADTIYRAFVTVSGSMRNLNTMLDSSGAGWTLTEAIDINDSGQIIGKGTLGGVSHGYLLTPAVGSLIWSASGTQSGGNGTWSAAGTTWLSGTSRVAWAPASKGVFSGTPGTVTISGSVSVGGGLDILANGFTLTGGTMALTGATDAARTITIASGATATLASAVVGTSGLTKAGAGTLVLSSTAGTLSGTTTITAGTLRLVAPMKLATSAVTVASGATLQIERHLMAGLARVDLSAGGSFDVSDSLAVVQAGFTPSTLVAEIVQGLGDGSWNGASGITSTIVAADTANGIPRAIGWLDNGDGSMTFGYAAPGDTNLDWSIDLLDVGDYLAAGKFDTGEPAAWSEGDYNYDAIVDLLDVGQYLSTSLFDTGPYAAFGGVAVVPEPAAGLVVGGALAVGAVFIRRRAARG